MRSYALTCLSVLLAAGCGPGGPPSLEGFGSIGETEDLPGDGDGDAPGDGDGDGDGDLGECIDRSFGNDSTIYFEQYLDSNLGSEHDGACGPNPGPDYSIAWQAPQEGPYRVTLFDDFGGWLTVLNGGCDGWLENCGALGFPTTVDFYAIEGQDYTFVVDAEWEGSSGYFTFILEPVTPIDCPHAELFDVPDSVVGSTLGADSQWSSFCGGDDGPDHAYVFYAPFTGTYRIDTSGSNYDTMLHVFEGFCSGEELGCDDDTDFDITSELFVNFVAGGVYTIVVDGWGTSAGEYQLNLELVDAVSICDDVEFLGSEVPAVASWPSDESAVNLFGGCGFASFERRHVWYAPDSGIYQVTLDGGPSSHLAMTFDGCTGNAVACDENPIVFEAFGGQEIVFISEWELEGFQEMTLRVDAVGAMPGCGFELLSEVPLIVNGTTSGAGNQHEGSCSVNPAPEVEYWWTAPHTGTYLLSLQGSSYDTMLYVRNGGCNGIELGCNDDTFDGQQVFLWSSLELDLVAGQTISIFVDAYSGSGSYQLTITQA